jgi:phage terminase large subunit
VDALTPTAWPPDPVQVYARRQRMLLRMRASASMREGALEYYRTRPAEWIDHWCDTFDPRVGASGRGSWLPLIMFRRQVHLVQFVMACIGGETDGLVEKSRDMGVTWVCAALSVWLWRFRGASVGWGSRKAMLVDHIGNIDSIFEKVRRIIMRMPREFWPPQFSEDCMAYMRIVDPGTGAAITGEAGDEIGRGGRKLVYFKDESAHYEHPESIEAALSENTRCQIDISSVSDPGTVFHRRREGGALWEPGQEVRRGGTNVLIMDWRDHPAKTQEWYDQRRAKFKNDGLLHVFAREVDRDYAASREGVIVRPEWIRAAVDAHVKLGIEEDGGWMGSLDVADEGADANAFSLRRGIVLRSVEEWAERDTGRTTRRVLRIIEGREKQVQYDCIGVGAGVKAEWNRLGEENLAPRGVILVPWNAAASPLNADKRLLAGDRQSPLIGDYFANLKAQGWWHLGQRFERTFRAVTEGVKFLADDLISISSEIPLSQRLELEKQLSQPVMTKSTRLKLLVDKAPSGSRSPNMGDSVMQNYWPCKRGYDTTGSWM